MAEAEDTTWCLRQAGRKLENHLRPEPPAAPRSSPPAMPKSSPPAELKSSPLQTAAISLTSSQRRNLRRKRLLARAPVQSREMALNPVQSRERALGTHVQPREGSCSPSIPDRATVPEFSPERSPVSTSSPERAPFHEFRPEWAPVPESSPERAPGLVLQNLSWPVGP